MLIMLLVGVLTAFMSSTAVTAMFIPVVLAISGRTGLNRKRLLMPLAVAATIGGMMTLISSLPNMIVVNLLAARGLPPLNFFSVTLLAVRPLPTTPCRRFQHSHCQSPFGRACRGCPRRSENA